MRALYNSKTNQNWLKNIGEISELIRKTSLKKLNLSQNLMGSKIESTTPIMQGSHNLRICVC